jgi:hypothetical protein
MESEEAFFTARQVVLVCVAVLSEEAFFTLKGSKADVYVIG